jgi:hypothetical protein
MGNNVNVDSREKRIFNGISVGDFTLDNFLGRHNDPSCGASHHQVVAASWRDGIPPAVGFDCVENGNVGANRLCDDDWFARIERIVLDDEVRAVLKDVTVEKATYAKKRDAHRSSLDHAVQHPSSCIFHFY